MDPALLSLLRVPEGHLGPTGSVVLVYGFALAAPLAVALVALIASARWRIKAALEQVACRPGAKLGPGPVALHGEVELAAGTRRAIRVEVKQLGEETLNKGNWTHRWTEVERRTELHPFYLRLASGERVRVEPGADLRYTDAMDGTMPLTTRRRVRFAELRPGESVFVYGELRRADDPEAEGGYRAAGTGWVLGPPRRGRMLVSSDPPGDGFRRRARARIHAAIITLIATLVVNAIIAPYHARRHWGRDEIGRVERLSEVRGSKGTRNYFAFVVVTTSQGRHVKFRDSLGLDSWRRLRVGTVVPVRFVEGWPSASVVGWGATIMGGIPFVVVVQLALSLIFYIALALEALAWHEGRKLVEDGSGRLPEIPTAG